MKKILIAFIVILGIVLLSGCAQRPSGEPAATTTAPVKTAAPAAGGATPAGTASKGSTEAFSEGIINCIKGTPWEYSNAAATGTYKVTYTIEGMTQYKGKDYCKVVGKVEGTGVALPAGYVWEYYFRYDKAAGTYADVCYKFTFSGAPAQEACVVTGASGTLVTE